MNRKRLILFPDDIVMCLLIESKLVGFTEVSRGLLKEGIFDLTLRLPAVAKMFRFRIDSFGKESEPFDQAIANLSASQLISRSLLGTTEMITARSVVYTTELPKGVISEIKYAAKFFKVAAK